MNKQSQNTEFSVVLWQMPVILQKALSMNHGPWSMVYANSYPISFLKYIPSNEIFSNTFFDRITASVMVFP